MGLMVESGEWAEYRFFQELRRLDRVARYGASAASSGVSPSSLALPSDDQVALGRRVEVMAAEILGERGHTAYLTSHKRAWDLSVGGARVEVKGARWDGRRYQAAIRNHQADVVLMACLDDGALAHRGAGDDGVAGWFVIPAAAVGGRRNLAIWSRDPLQYIGRWTRWLEAWDVVDEAVAAAGPYVQLRLLEV